jgi:hypothetical protein
MGVRLPSSTYLAAIKPCTRRHPESVQSFWTPSDGDVRSLEAELGPVLQRALNRKGREMEPLRASEFYRQYVGIIHHSGRRTIYVNGFHEYLLRENRRVSRGIDSLRWRDHPIDVCDGGNLFFGVEFDPVRRTFSHLTFNSRAG